MLRELVASRNASTAAMEFSFEARFDRDDPVFAGHFPARPVVPGVLLIECVEAALAARNRRVIEVTSVKFHAVAAPEETLRVLVECLALDEARFEIKRDATLVASGVCGLAETLTG